MFAISKLAQFSQFEEFSNSILNIIMVSFSGKVLAISLLENSMVYTFVFEKESKHEFHSIERLDSRHQVLHPLGRFRQSRSLFTEPKTTVNFGRF